MALFLPSIFAAIVVGALLAAIYVEGLGTLAPTSLNQSRRCYRAFFCSGAFGAGILLTAGFPWAIPVAWPLGWILLGGLVDALTRPFSPGFPNPFVIDWHPYMDVVLGCLLVVGPFVNVLLLYSVGLRVDQAIERRRERRQMRETKTQP